MEKQQSKRKNQQQTEETRLDDERYNDLLRKYYKLYNRTTVAILAVVWVVVSIICVVLVIGEKLKYFDCEYQRVECDICGAALPAKMVKKCSNCGADAGHLWLIKVYCPECGDIYLQDDIQFCIEDGTPVQEEKVMLNDVSWCDSLEMWARSAHKGSITIHY